jgi:hypothetical protein
MIIVFGRVVHGSMYPHRYQDRRGLFHEVAQDIEMCLDRHEQEEHCDARILQRGKDRPGVCSGKQQGGSFGSAVDLCFSEPAVNPCTSANETILWGRVGLRLTV